MTRKNTKNLNSIKSDFNFRYLSKQNFFSIDTLIYILIILIFFILIILFYLDYKTTERFDSLFLSYQILFDHQTQMTGKLEELIKEATFKNDVNSIEVPVDNSERINKILSRVGSIVIFYFMALGIGIFEQFIQNLSIFDVPTLFQGNEILNLDNNAGFIQNNGNGHTQIVTLEPENPNDDNRVILPLHDTNVVQIIPEPGHAVIIEHGENPVVETEIAVNNDRE